MIEGREPLHPDEIALGSITLRSLRRRVGDDVTLTAPTGAERRLRVVGRVVLHRGTFVDSVMTPGKGGIVHPESFRWLAPPSIEPYPGSFLVRLQPDADRARTPFAVVALAIGLALGSPPDAGPGS